ncbi:hypothetical protein GIY30_23790 [Gordonia sp. HNM0687]|uniref:Secreted protein n=1 Tax=Gordonia mangrovi TaxID=2665643 RepID=A0A6L7GZC4_9ACTN|nr:hypothetical protein [Gordonia mangrovi]MXP24348.1 hypothetical protein [Gordonia mangrovi]
MSKKRVVAVGAGVVLSAAATSAFAPVAEALSVTPAPGGGYVHVTSDEAAVLHHARVGEAVDAVTRWQRGTNGLTFGDTINRASHVAVVHQGSTLIVGAERLGTPDAAWRVVVHR